MNTAAKTVKISHRTNSNEEKDFKKKLCYKYNAFFFIFRYNIQLSLRVFIVYEYTCMYIKLAKDEKI